MRDPFPRTAQEVPTNLTRQDNIQQLIEKLVACDLFHNDKAAAGRPTDSVPDECQPNSPQSAGIVARICHLRDLSHIPSAVKIDSLIAST